MEKDAVHNFIKCFFIVGVVMSSDTLNAQVLINEFMAVNDTILQDEDLDCSDWVELKNTSSNAVNLTGWYLTDRADQLTQWQFPATIIQPGDYLVVFASDKDRAIAGSELHTNFKLSGDGEYLALVLPDGTTVVSEFAPVFPPQVEDISYGLGGGTDVALIADRATCSARVPTDASDGTSWQLAGFDDGAWETGITGVGYDTSSPYDSLIHFDLESEMKDQNSSVYVRIPFSVANAADFVSLTLRMKHDDGFVAYLNGVEVAAAHAPATLDWQSRATTTYPEGPDEPTIGFVDFDLSAFRHLLVEGANLLAIHGLNDDKFSSDMLVLPELSGVVVDGSTSAGYLSTPTPGAENSDPNPVASPAVEFSIPGAVCLSAVSVALSVTNSAQQIYYTLDGSEPSLSSSVYSSAISITSTTTLRARSFESGFALGPINSETYIFLDNDVKSFSSDLPIIVVDNMGVNSTIPTTKDPVRQAAFMAIFEPGPNGRTSLTNNFSLGSRAGIFRRGRSTLRDTHQKPNLSVETWGAGANDDEKITPFNMPGESDWVLWAPYDFDRAGLRNAFIYELSNQTGNYAMRTQFVEVFLNVSGGNVSMADYAGFYVFMEKIKVDNDRVDVEKMTPLDNQAPNVTGGYMLAFDDGGGTAIHGTGYYAWGANGFFINYPSAVDLTSIQASYVKNYILDFEAQLGNSNPVTGYPSYIDEDKFIDHHILNMLAKNCDGLRLSTYLSKERNGKLAMGPLWDFDRSMESMDGRDDLPRTWDADNGGVGTKFFESTQISWWSALFENADFSQAYVDRWQAHRPNKLSNSNVVAIIDGMAAEVAEARARDIPKRGKTPRFGSNGLNGTQQGEVDHMKWFLTTRMAWVDSHFLGSPVLSTNSGPISGTIQLSISSPSGHPIYYTLDGSDPRAPGGSLAPSALIYSGAISVTPDSIVRARAWNGTAWGVDSVAPYHAPWSGVSEGVFHRADQKLLLTEVHYNPEAPATLSPYTSDDFEFVELQNIGAETLDLRGYALCGGVDFSFDGSAVESLPAGSYVVVVRNLAAFSSRYNITGMHIAGEYTGMLSNSGENVRLEFYKHKLFDVLFNDARDWPTAADGGGSSLIPINDSISAQGFDILDYSGNWRASTYIGGSPGQADPELAAELLINEIIAHTDTGNAPPFDSNDQIELYNPTEGSVTLDSFWFLSDNVKDPEKYNIPEGTIVSGDWAVFDEDLFHPDRISGFGLDKAGEQVVLSHRPGGELNRVVQCIDFKGQANGAAWGRYPDGNAFFQTLDPTADAANRLPAPGIRVKELMYNPLPLLGINSDEVLEYILLANTSSSSVAFAGGVEVTNTWRLNGGVNYNFDPGVSMEVGENLWLVPFDPEKEPSSKTLFCTTYGLDADSVRMMGPYSGDLSDRGERFALERPQASDDPLDPTGISWIIVDEVTWMDEAPWPQEDDSTRLPLMRVGAAGNDPKSWATSADIDSDGLPDSWEIDHFGAVNAAKAGADDDWDGDGLSNYFEWRAGTDPTDRASIFKITSTSLAEDYVLQWTSEPSKVYSLWTSTNLLTGEFMLYVPEIMATPPINIHTTNVTTAESQFYRIGVDDQ